MILFDHFHALKVIDSDVVDGEYSVHGDFLDDGYDTTFDALKNLGIVWIVVVVRSKFFKIFCDDKISHWCCACICYQRGSKKIK